jgi:hypothetical protein
MDSNTIYLEKRMAECNVQEGVGAVQAELVF